MMSDIDHAAEVRALIAEARLAAGARDIHMQDVDLFRRLADALGAAHAEPDDDELYRAIYYAAEGVIVDEHGAGVLGLSDEVAEAVMTVVAGFRRSARVPVSRDDLAENLRRIHFDGTGCGTTASTACSNCFGPSPMTAREIAEHLSTTHDIYPKADRKPADSSNGDD